MNRFNYHINESNDADAIDLGFVSTSDFNSNYVDSSFFESQDSFLNTIEPINGSQDTSIFLNPIYEILGENGYGKDFCSDQASVPVTTHGKIKPTSSWEKDHTHASAISSNEFSREMEKHNFAMQQPRTASTVIDLCNLNESTEQSIFLSGHHELALPNYTVLGAGYTSTMNQCYMNLEQQRMSYMNVAPLSNINQQQTAMNTSLNDVGKEISQNFSENLLNTVISMPSYNIIPPTVFDECSIRAQDLVNHNTFDVTRSLYENGTNAATNMFPLPLKNAIYQHEPRCATKIYSKTVSQPLYQTDLSLDFQQSHNYQNIVNGDNPPSTIPNLRSVANCSKNIKNFSNNATMYPSKSFPNQQLLSDASRHLPLMNLGQTKNNWTAVFPRTNFIYPPETIVMHPLRTRKLIASRRITAINVEAPSEQSTSSTVIAPKSVCYLEPNKLFNESNASAELTNVIHIQNSQKSADMEDDRNNISKYFDTTSVNIPMIKERSRSDIKTENRRKQKLHTIPGAENLVFEVQGNDSRGTDDFIQIQTTIGEQTKTYNMTDNGDPYPESELPELEDIFRRKKKTNTTTAPGSKRTYHISQDITVGDVSLNKKHCPNNIIRQLPTVAVIKPSDSFKDNISVSIAIRRGKPNSASSESDTAESIDDVENGQSLVGRSLKCNKCRKLFKTTRSLAIHTKRCVNLDQQKILVSKDGNSDLFINTKPVNTGIQEQYPAKETQSEKSNNIQEVNIPCYMCKETSLSELAKGNSEKSIINLLPNNKKHPRPITRSQTRRSAGRSIKYTDFAKQSK